MRWTFIVQQKFKVAVLLACVMLLIIVTNIISRKNVGNISQSFNSIYNDRLVPATDIFYMAENLFNKRLLLENYLANETNNDVAAIQTQLRSRTTRIDSLIFEFEKTFMTNEELKVVEDFKSKTQHYAKLESAIVKLLATASHQEALLLFHNDGKKLFDNTIDNLEKLTKIQSSIGRDLADDSQSDANVITTLFSIQLILVFVIGAVVQALIFASKSFKIKKQQYHLN